MLDPSSSPEHLSSADEDNDNQLPSFLALTEEAEQEEILIRHLTEEIIASVPDFTFLFRSRGTLSELLLKTLKGLPPTSLRRSAIQNLPRHLITVEHRLQSVLKKKRPIDAPNQQNFANKRIKREPEDIDEKTFNPFSETYVKQALKKVKPAKQSNQTKNLLEQLILCPNTFAEGSNRFVKRDSQHWLPSVSKKGEVNVESVLQTIHQFELLTFASATDRELTFQMRAIADVLSKLLETLSINNPLNDEALIKILKALVSFLAICKFRKGVNTTTIRGKTTSWPGYEKALARCLSIYIHYFALLSTEYTRNKFFGECLYNTALLTDNSPLILFDVILALHAGFEEDNQVKIKTEEEEEEEDKEKEKENDAWQKSSAALKMTCHWLFLKTLIKEDRILRDDFGPVVANMKNYLHFIMIAKRAIHFLESLTAQSKKGKPQCSITGDPVMMVKDIRRVASRVPVPTQLQLWVSLIKSKMTPEMILNWLLDELNEEELREVMAIDPNADDEEDEGVAGLDDEEEGDEGVGSGGEEPAEFTFVVDKAGSDSTRKSLGIKHTKSANTEDDAMHNTLKGLISGFDADDDDVSEKEEEKEEEVKKKETPKSKGKEQKKEKGKEKEVDNKAPAVVQDESNQTEGKKKRRRSRGKK